MVKTRAYLIFGTMCLLILCGCATTASRANGIMGEGSYRRVVILGEHYNYDTATQYANKYNAKVLYTASRGFLANSVSNSLRGVIGPTRSMRDLILELESMNYTDGEWVLIIPSSSEHYFLITLRNIDSDSLQDTDAVVYLTKGVKNNAIESELARVSGGRFKIRYGEPL